MTWKTYAVALLVFNLLGLLVVYLLQRLQGILPLNPQGLAAVSPDSSFNTAVSFATQHQLAGLRRRNDDELPHADAGADRAELRLGGDGHGRADRADPRDCPPHRADDRQFLGRPDALARSTSCCRSSLVLALVLVSQGVVQTFSSYQTATLVQPAVDASGQTVTEQMLAVGPAASQIAIKQLGTNGGGFFNVNSAHPFENPTPLSNFLELLAILLIPAALCYTFGKMVGDTRQGWAMLAAMTIIFVVLVTVTVWAEAERQSGAHSVGR